MSILIKGMEMPLNCRMCNFCEGRVNQFCDADEEKRELTEFEISIGRPNWCPLVEVPTPHGRLIDADALPTYDKPIGKMMMFGGEYVYTQTAIDEAPTIIPAEGEK